MHNNESPEDYVECVKKKKQSRKVINRVIYFM